MFEEPSWNKAAEELRRLSTLIIAVGEDHVKIINEKTKDKKLSKENNGTNIIVKRKSICYTSNLDSSIILLSLPFV